MSDHRLKLIDVPSQRARVDFAASVRDGLRSTPKTLPSRFFYDHRGSELFEQITELPEYYPTRCEASIFAERAAEIVSTFGCEMSLVEFGSGSSLKTRQLIWAILGCQGTLDYAPIDISGQFLRESSEALLSEFSGLHVTALASEYFDAISAMPQFDKPRLILFLGGNIGNFERGEALSFLSQVRKQMSPLDRLLIGTDLVKDPAIIEAAYNDAQGVTAEFNKNLLARINTELGGHFDLDNFEHHAPFVRDLQRIEMRLVSKSAQRVCIDDLRIPVNFEMGESIRTEISQKYTFESFASLASEAGLELFQRWTDANGWFAVHLLRPA